MSDKSQDDRLVELMAEFMDDSEFDANMAEVDTIANRTNEFIERQHVRSQNDEIWNLKILVADIQNKLEENERLLNESSIDIHSLVQFKDEFESVNDILSHNLNDRNTDTQIEANEEIHNSLNRQVADNQELKVAIIETKTELENFCKKTLIEGNDEIYKHIESQKKNIELIQVNVEKDLASFEEKIKEITRKNHAEAMDLIQLHHDQISTIREQLFEIQGGLKIQSDPEVVKDQYSEILELFNFQKEEIKKLKFQIKEANNKIARQENEQIKLSAKEEYNIDMTSNSSNSNIWIRVLLISNIILWTVMAWLFWSRFQKNETTANEFQIIEQLESLNNSDSANTSKKTEAKENKIKKIKPINQSLSTKSETLFPEKSIKKNTSVQPSFGSNPSTQNGVAQKNEVDNPSSSESLKTNENSNNDVKLTPTNQPPKAIPSKPKMDEPAIRFGD